MSRSVQGVVFFKAFRAHWTVPQQGRLCLLLMDASCSRF